MSRPRLLLLLMMTAMTVAVTHGKKLLDTTPSSSTVVSGYHDEETVRERMRELPLHDIEGIWELTGEGSVLAIESDPDRKGVYRMVVIRSADISVAPGTVTGYLAPASRHREYDSRIFSSRTDDHTMLTNPTRNVITLSDNGTRLSFHPYGRKLRFNWWRLLLPYMYRTLVTPLERPAGDIDGCVRIYPAPIPPLNPRYL